MNLRNDIKALMFDIDGTIVNRELEVSEYTKRVLLKAKEKGYLLAINTGRPYFSAYRVLKNNQIDDIFDAWYCCNGCERISDGKSIYLKHIEPSTYHQLTNLLMDDYLIMGAYYKDKYLLMNHVPKAIPNYENWATSRYTEAKIINFEELNDIFPKLVILYNPEYKKELMEKINSIKCPEVEFVVSGVNIMEIVPYGINKGSAVVDYALLNKIDPKQIMTFGDAENDIDALTVGSGCYVEGKDVDGSKNISMHCPSVYEDGVAKFIEEYLL